MGSSIKLSGLYDNSKEYKQVQTAGIAQTNIPVGTCVRSENDKCYINDKEDSILIEGITYDNTIKGNVVGVIRYGLAKVRAGDFRVSKGDYVSCYKDGSIKPSNNPEHQIGYVVDEEGSYYIVNLLIGGRV